MKTIKNLIIVILLLIISIKIDAQIKVLTNGNVGIDETNPVCKLSIGTEGYINAKAYIYNSNTANGSRALQGYQNPNNGYCYGLVGSIKYGDIGNKMVGTYGSAYRGSTPNVV